MTSLDFYRMPIHDGIRGQTMRQLTMEGNIDIKLNAILTTNLGIKEASNLRMGIYDRALSVERDLYLRRLYHGDLQTCTLFDTLQVNTQIFTRTVTAETLGVGVTTFTATGETMIITGDAGGNTIATITGAVGQAGRILILFFVDANVTITDDNTHANNTVDLSGAFTSADDTVLILISDGTSWYEISRSAN